MIKVINFKVYKGSKLVIEKMQVLASMLTIDPWSKVSPFASILRGFIFLIASCAIHAGQVRMLNLEI